MLASWVACGLSLLSLESHALQLVRLTPQGDGFRLDGTKYYCTGAVWSLRGAPGLMLLLLWALAK